MMLTSGISIDGSGNDIRAIFKEAKAREAVERAREDGIVAIGFKSDGIPTSTRVKDIINSRVGESRDTLISQHPYWKEMKLRAGLSALISAAHNAYVDICRHEAALASLSSNWKEFDEHVQYTVSNPFQKDVMAFCAATIGIVDCVRRLKSRRYDLASDIDSLISRIFSDDLAAFIKDLRNNLAHGQVVVPGWAITREAGAVTGTMRFSRAELIALGEWSGGSRRLIERYSDDGIEIKPIIEAYHKKAQEFATAISALFARNKSFAEIDFYEIEDAYHKSSRQQWVNLLVTQFSNGRNPYQFLHQFFSAQEVREILRRPNFSKEQVDFIITLKSTEVSCSDDLRQKLYALFSVKSETF